MEKMIEPFREGIDGIKVWWDEEEQDLMIQYPRSCDGSLTHSVFCSERLFIDWSKIQKNPFLSFLDKHGWDKSFVEELKSRGYDITTLKFEIKRKTGNEPP